MGKHFINLWNATLETGAKAICLYKFWLLKVNQNFIVVEDVGSGMISSLIRNSALMTVNKKTQCEYRSIISFILCEVQILTLLSYEKYCLYIYVMTYDLVDTCQRFGITRCLPEDGGNTFVRIIFTQLQKYFTEPLPRKHLP